MKCERSDMQNETHKKPRSADYGFETFEIFEGNGTAYQEAFRLAGKDMLPDCNPLWLTGLSGSGKTHLLYSIKEKMEQKNPPVSVKMISCDMFVRELMSVLKEHLHENITGIFIEQFCKEDVIMIEDVDYCLEGKEATQEEIARIIVSLVKKHGKQVVLTSHDRLEPLAGWLSEPLPMLKILPVKNLPVQTD